MPVYHSVGIKATLSTTSLQQSLEKQFITTAVATHNGKNASPSGRPAMWRDLQERPIDINGHRNGVMHFIGPDGDMPFFMVEAAEDLHATDLASRPATAPFDAKQSRRSLVTDLATPKDTLRRSRTFNDSSKDFGVSGGANSTRENVLEKTPAVRPRLRETSINALTQLSNSEQKESIASKESALLLRVDIQEKGSSPKWPRALDNHMLPHLKVEVFLHGELADVVFLNKSRNAVQLHEDMLVFYGTRAARQLEKPWIYRGNHSIKGADMTAAQRWSTYQKALSTEARLRGTNIHGSPPPSAEFLQALSLLDLPNHLQRHANLSVIDVVITTGIGFKYGMDGGFVAQPLRMLDRRYAVRTGPSLRKGTRTATDDLSSVEDAANDHDLGASQIFSSRLHVPATTADNKSNSHLAPRTKKQSNTGQQRRGSAPAGVWPENSQKTSIENEPMARLRPVRNNNEESKDVNQKEVMTPLLEEKLKSRSVAKVPRLTSEATGASTPTKQAQDNIKSMARDPPFISQGIAQPSTTRTRRDSAISKSATPRLGVVSLPTPVTPSPFDPSSNSQLSIVSPDTTKSAQEVNSVSTGEKKMMTPLGSTRRPYKRRTKPQDAPDEEFQPPSNRSTSFASSNRRRSSGVRSISRLSDRRAGNDDNETYPGCSVGYPSPGRLREAGRARPGEFEETQLVVGIRFIVL